MATRVTEAILALQDKVREWPTQPGVYIMRDEGGRILYVGKAKNLRNRVRSYFQKIEGLTPKTRLLVSKIINLEYTVTNTELEALLLECNLIKKHRPRYNIRLKDDKNYPYVVLDFTHPFPQFRITRKVISSPKLKYFGPYSGSVKDIGRFLLKTFQIRDCSDSKFRNRKRPCLNHEIGTCTAPCVAYVSEENYSKQIQEAILFLQGKKKILLQTLKAEMSEASVRLEYERAKTIRDKIFAVRTITEKQNAILTENFKDIDVVGCYQNGNDLSWVILFIRSGLLTGRRAERTSLTFETVEENTRSFLEQFYTLSLIPDEIWLSTDFSDRETLETFLSERAEKKIQIRVRRSEQPMRLLGMAHENAKLLYHDGVKTNKTSASEELQKLLDLKDPPQSIEGIDVSNLLERNPAVSLVHFEDEKPLKSRYRLYYPKTVQGQNDFAMIFEVVTRRFSKPDPPFPDLLMIDGGKGQLQSAVKALESLNVVVPICSLAKSKTFSSFTRKEVEKSQERIFVPNRKNPIILREGHPALQLLQQIRDEAHRFAIKSHRRRRSKEMLIESPLTKVRGIGAKTREKLLKKFGGLEEIRKASIEALVASGLTLAIAETLHKSLGGEE
jgi:excinuclease ABC subunit C